MMLWRNGGVVVKMRVGGLSSSLCIHRVVSTDKKLYSTFYIVSL